MSLFRRGIRSQKIIRRKWDNFLSIVIIFIGAIFIFFVLWFSTAFIPWFKIERIDISGNRIISGEIIDQAIREKFNDKILWFIPRQSILLFKANKTEKDLLKEFPKISEINIDRTGFKSLRVKLTERDFTALWCDDGQIKCFLIDDTGVAYEKFPEGSSREDLLVLENGGEPEVFKTFSTGDIFPDLLKSVSFLTGIGFNVLDVSIPDKNEYDFTLRGGGMIKLGQNFYIDLINKFPLLEDEYNWGSGSDFEYVDLRFPAKAFVK